MNKKLIALLAAALLLLSVAACSDKDDDKDNNKRPLGTLGDINESENNDTDETEGDETSAPDELNPVFVEKSMTVVVLPERATIRNAPDKNGDSEVAWPAEGTELTVTGESEQWYRLSYGGEVRYIRKSVVGDAALLTGFTDIADTVTVNVDSNMRSFPLVTSYTFRVSVKTGVELERVAVGAEWSIVKYTVTVETESGSEEEVKTFYIHNTCIDTEADTTETQE